MKKLINLSAIYAILALAAGVFYREFTKGLNFTGETMLSFLHPHILVLGSIFLLIALLLSMNMPLLEQKKFNIFLILHTVGLPFLTTMMLVRGILQVLGANLSKGANGAIAGIAGISHAIIGAAIIFLFVALKDAIRAKTDK